MLLNTLLRNIRSIVDSSVIKINSVAKSYETLDSIREGDRYVLAVQKADTFFSYSEYEFDAVYEEYKNIDPYRSMSAEELEATCSELAANPSQIPIEYRDRILNRQREIIVNEYIEGNQYYRMLNGQPVDESEFLYITEEQRVLAEIATAEEAIPIHQMTDIDIYKLEISGVLDTIKNQNPNFKYLNYLGDKRISIVEARNASNFAIIRMNKDDDISDEFYDKFIRLYNQSRDYFTIVIYNSEYSKIYSLYDNFIGLCIMMMTIQRIISNTFKNGIEREFFDWEFIQNMYKTYNIPFIKTLSMDDHIIILKNLNNLLRYKSTDKVLIDVCTLLGYSEIDIFRYYLVKQQLMDENDNPVFIYQKDDNGNVILDDKGNKKIDYAKTYDIYFQAIDIREQNILSAMLDSTNRFDYNMITSSDPYWTEDENLEKMKYGVFEENNEEYQIAYNYVRSKYIGLNLMYRMADVVFELTYAFNMLVNKKEEITDIRLPIPKVHQSNEYPLFDVIVFLIALVCKLEGFVGNIQSNPSVIENIYSFNFDETDITEIIKKIENEKDIFNSVNENERTRLLDFFNNLTITSDSDIDRIYEQIRNCNTFIIDKIRNAKSIEEYRFYRNIYHVIMISENQTEMFSYVDTDGNTVMAETYAEYLEKNQPELFTSLNELTEKDNISTLIDHVLVQVESIFNSLDYTFFINGTNNPLFTALTSLLNFFKSYTTDIALMNVIYLFNSRYHNLIKLCDSLSITHKLSTTSDSFNLLYSDNIRKNIKLNLKKKTSVFSKDNAERIKIIENRIV